MVVVLSCEAATVPTAVPLAEFSATAKPCDATAGGSTTFVRLIVTLASADTGKLSLSVALTVNAYDGVVSKSSWLPLATVIAPLELLIAKTLLPPTIEYETVCPASGSVALTVPTDAPLGLFSARLKLYGAPPNTGAW